MFISEQVFNEEEVLSLFQEAVSDPHSLLRVQLIDPIIEVLSTPEGRKQYISLGNQFLEANAEMLAKEATMPHLYE